MKRRIRCLLLVLLFCLVLCVSAAAAEQTGAQLSYVTDAAGLLSENENMLLEKMAESVSKKYGVGVYIVTMEDYRDFHSEGVYKATYTIYHEYTMGEGPNRDGIMLLLIMTDRKWAMFCYGSRCEYAFNSYGQEKLEKVFLDNFGVQLHKRRQQFVLDLLPQDAGHLIAVHFDDGICHFDLVHYTFSLVWFAA